MKLWMEACNIDIYHDVFVSNGIGGSHLKYLNSENLQVLEFSMNMHIQN